MLGTDFYHRLLKFILSSTLVSVASSLILFLYDSSSKPMQWILTIDISLSWRMNTKSGFQKVLHGIYCVSVHTKHLPGELS